MSRAPSSIPLAIGRYVMLSEIASGGMATVHYGRFRGPAGFQRTVAIKRLHPHYAKDPAFAAMLVDEGRLLARVSHPNVIRVLDVIAVPPLDGAGPLELSPDRELFLVMEYVHGEPLSALMRSARGAGDGVPLDVASAIVCGLLHGLHAAHEAKDEHGAPLHIVHRDVSPQNVMVGADGVARALDFGIAKAAGRIQVTADGRVKGKLAYMPPEQLGGARVDRRTDLYAAGVVLWELLTGRDYFDSSGSRSAEGLPHKPPPPSRVLGTVPPALDAVVLRALSRNPAKRFASARDMAVALEGCVPVASPSRVAGMGGGDCGRCPSLAGTRARGSGKLSGLAFRRRSALRAPRRRR